MHLQRIADPSVDLVSVAEARAFLGLGSDTSEDGNLGTLIPAATQDVEDFLRRPLVNASWRLVFDRDEVNRCEDVDAFSSFDLVAALPLARITSVSAVRVYDTDGEATTLEADTNYALDGRDEDANLYLDSAVWPVSLRLTECLEVEVVAGFGALAANVPAKFKRLVLNLLAYDFEHRGDDGSEGRCAVLQAAAGDRVIRV